MVIPVVSAVERNGNQHNPVPPGSGNQTASGFFGETGFDPHSVVIKGEKLIMVVHRHFPFGISQVDHRGF